MLLASLVFVGPKVIKHESGDLPKEMVEGKLPEKAEPQQNIPSLEMKTDELITAMEIAKKYGDQIDGKVKMEAKNSLEELCKSGSDRYNNLKQRYDRL